MAKREVTQYSSALVSHNKESSTLVVEASDLQLKRFEYLYDDASDVGIELINEKTGNVTRWCLVEEIIDRLEHEVLGWVLWPTAETVRAQPAVRGYQLKIIND